MTDRTYNVLFLCTHNSARSVLAECYLNANGDGRFRAYSAGSFPSGKVNPFALELLERNHISTQGVRSKGWDEFTKPGSPHMDFIITVCDQAAGEVCPIWPGKPLSAHWGVEDPAAVTGTDDEKRAAFKKALALLERRISLLVNLPNRSLDNLAMEQQLAQIGKVK
jgi:arsenate reductase